MMIKLQGNGNIPVIAEVDLLIVGGGLAGLPVAHKYGEMGKRVMLIEKGLSWGLRSVSGRDLGSDGRIRTLSSLMTGFLNWKKHIKQGRLSPYLWINSN